MFCPHCGEQTSEGGPCPGCGMFGDVALSAPTLEIPALQSVVLDGRYRVDRVLARGGMGEVFEGLDLSLKRPVAIKFLADRYASDPEITSRFRFEAEALASLDHPTVVPVYSVGSHDGRPYFVMKLVRGQTVEQLVRTWGPLPLKMACHLGLQICDGLDRIHQAGYVHRDIKPSNLVVDDDGRCTILDFGILRAQQSKLTGTGFVVGTPEYMSPEQGRDARLADARSDVYSLGATLYTILTGTPPFQGSTTYDLVHQHHTAPVVAPSAMRQELAPAVDAFVGRALAKEPADRFESAAAMAAGLRALAEPSWRAIVPGTPPGTTSPTGIKGELLGPPLPTTRRRRRGRRPAWMGAAAGVIAIAAAILAVTLWPAPRELEGDGSGLGPAKVPSGVAAPRPSDRLQAGDTTLHAPAGAASRLLQVSPQAARTPRRPGAATTGTVTGKTVSRAATTAAADRPPRSSRRVGRTRSTISTATRKAKAPTPSPPASGAGAAAASRRSAPPPPKPPPLIARQPGPPADIRVVTLHQGQSVWAQIAIDGKRVGTSPIARHRLPPGKHVVTARRVGYIEGRAVIKLRAAENRKVTIVLERANP